MWSSSTTAHDTNTNFRRKTSVYSENAGFRKRDTVTLATDSTSPSQSKQGALRLCLAAPFLASMKPNELLLGRCQEWRQCGCGCVGRMSHVGQAKRRFNRLQQR